jgi:hypothetical protein
MDIIYSKELAIPLYQVGLLLSLGTLGLLFGRVKLALMINYLFALYWGYWLNREVVLGKGVPALDLFTFCYFGFGLLVVVLAILGFLHRPD